MFITAFAFYFIVQLNLSLYPAIIRDLPVEVDDSYGMILKASQMRSGCFLQYCTALEDLREQFLAPTASLSSAGERLRQYQRVLLVYHPLQSLALVTLEEMGLSAEVGLDVIFVLGKIFITLSIAYWIYAMFGRRTTTVALILLAPAVFIGQGLHNIVPSNIAFGLATFMWAEIILQTDRARKLLLPSTIAMLLLHPMGQPYALITLLFFLMFSRPFLGKKYLGQAGLGILLVAVYFVLPNIVHKPILGFDTSLFFGRDWDYLGAIKETLPSQMDIVKVWINSFGGSLLLTVLLLVGIVNLTFRAKGYGLLLMGITLLAFVAASLLYIVPVWGAIAFRRAWIPLALFLVGLVAEAIATTAAIVYTTLKNTLIQAKPRRGSEHYGPAALRVLLLSAIVALLLFFSLFTYARFYTRHYQLTQNKMIDRHNFTLDENQPLSIFSEEKSPVVLYMREIPLYFYLANGGLNSHAVYYPALADTEGESKWLQANGANLDYLVNVNPLYRLPHTQDGAILLQPDTALEINAQGDLAGLNLLLEAREADNTLEITNGDGESVVLAVPPGAPMWLSLPARFAAGERLQLRTTGAVIELSSLRLESAQATAWPWEEGLVLTATDPDGITSTAEFSTSWLSEGFPVALRVLDDNGFTVLAEVLHE